ncbi:hypothetical protein [Arthrobacter sp. SDTb3-6]|uniref:hypothetical protein n=1 Tax=Arthrobacter sp. SDTb3-6 TaxID=2713571 RepID=UPI00159D8766|nr:hypothetical protein [Arthrobacter sp. SDTb3-6]NVM99383.1 hypothetical protein [Arthrobacter sp. SDTb3-6]
MGARSFQLPRRTTPAFLLSLSAVLALFLSGCGAPFAARPTHYTPAPAALQDKVDCLATPYWNEPLMTAPPAVADKMGSVPRGFVPVDVVVCPPGQRIVPQAGPEPARATILEEHHAGNYGPLLAALAQPSDREEGGACFSMAETIPDLWLVDARGKAVHVQWPRTGCGFPKPGTREALAALPVSSSKTIDTRPSGAVEQFTPPPARVLAGADCLTTARWYEGNGTADPSAKDMGSIPAGFEPAAAVECTAFGPNATDARGTWRTITQKRFTGDLAPLVKVLRSPSDRAPGKLVCEANLEIIADLWLVDAGGRAVHVQWPLTACGKAKEGPKEALARLTVVQTTVLKAVRLPAPQPKDLPAPPATATAP